MKTNKSKSQSTPTLLPLAPAARRSIGAAARGGGQKVAAVWSQPPGPRHLYEPDCALVALLQSTGNSPAGEALGLLAAAGLFASVANARKKQDELQTGLYEASETLYRQAIQRIRK